MAFDTRKEMILALFDSPDFSPMKFRELAGFLQVPKEERDELALILNELLSEGKIEISPTGRYGKTGANIKQGTFQGTLKGFGFVLIEGEQDVFISARDVNGARDKDLVEIAIVAESDGRKGQKREGRVLKILERGQNSIVGIFTKKDNGGFVDPDNQKFGSSIRIYPGDTKNAVTGHKVVVEITDFGDGIGLATGKIIEILGHIEDPGVDIMSVIRGNGIPVDFPPEVKRMAENVPDEVDPAEFAGRKDLRDVLTVTIDGDDAKDLDDAVSIEPIDAGFRLGVHIADVSNYVRENTALDREALNRGTSVYLVDRVIPMLPHELSNGICSLNAGTDRLALSVIMDIDRNGTVVDHEICESVIHVDRRMSYNKVFEILENDKAGSGNEAETMQYGTDFVEMFKNMLALSDIIRGKREKRGSLDFDIPETEIILDEEGYPKDIAPFRRNRAHMIIEDFMLAANETVAEEYFWLEAPFVYRIHEEPDEERIHKLAAFISNFGYNLHIANSEVHPKELQKLLASIQGTDEELLISRLALRSMKQAKYSTECDGHFGLAAKYYCHFTSPIRRYPDLQIHRIIKENLRAGLQPNRVEHYKKILPDVCFNSSKLERRADEAERETEKIKKAQYMLQFVGDSFEGVVSGVSNYGVYVELPNTVEGMIRLSDLHDDFYDYDEDNYRVIGQNTGKEFKLGQKTTVIVASVDPIINTIAFMPYNSKKKGQ